MFTSVKNLGFTLNLHCVVIMYTFVNVMINTEQFIERLQKIKSHYGVSSSAFAEKVGVQRSSISHIFSGRNKPSLEFVLKLLNAFPDVDLYWLLNGKGTFPKIDSPKTVQPASLMNNFSDLPKHLEKTDLFTDHIISQTQKTSENLQNDLSNAPALPQETNAASAEIERIVIFFKNGSFKSYNN